MITRLQKRTVLSIDVVTRQFGFRAITKFVVENLNLAVRMAVSPSTCSLIVAHIFFVEIGRSEVFLSKNILEFLLMCVRDIQRSESAQHYMPTHPVLTSETSELKE